MEMVTVSSEALASIKRLVSEAEGDAALWRWCVAHVFPKTSSEGHWICPDARGVYHFAPTPAEAVKLAMEDPQSELKKLRD